MWYACSGYAYCIQVACLYAYCIHVAYILYTGIHVIVAYHCVHDMG